MYNFEDSKLLYNSDSLRVVSRPDGTVAAGCLDTSGMITLSQMAKKHPQYHARHLPDGACYIIEATADQAYQFGRDFTTLMEGF